MSTIYGEPHLFGVPSRTIKRVFGCPPGKQHIYTSPKDFAKVYVETPTGVRVFSIQEKRGFRAGAELSLK